MNLKFWKKSEPVKPVSTIRKWYNDIVFAVVAATLFRWGVAQAFVIPTPSMENTLLVGDYLFVSKLHYGVQTPQTPLQVPLTHQRIWGTNIPSYLDWIQLPVYRFPGFTEVKRGDVVVFYIPPVALNEGIDYPRDLKNNYVKRCVGVPGDSLRVIDGEVWVNEERMEKRPGQKHAYWITARDIINKRNLRQLNLDNNDYYPVGQTQEGTVVYRMFLTNEQAGTMSKLPYVLKSELDTNTSGQHDPGLFPQPTASSWSVDNYGPLVIPKAGVTVPVNEHTLAAYGEIISRYEGHDEVEIVGGRLRIDGKDIAEYSFKQNYYFMMGDNRHNSLDSRFWGFVPEDHIVGKPLFVWFSMDNDADLSGKIRWSRLFTRID